jgi:major membrane immunogen (membrane-anchored lipoprotein)
MRRPTSDSTRAGIALLVALMLVWLSGCGPAQPDPDALRDEDGNALYRDGVYIASNDYTSQEEWRPYLQIDIRRGLIHSVCFDAVSPRGVRLTQDERFLEVTRLHGGLDLARLVGEMSDCLIASQRLPVTDCMPGTEWTTYFSQLTETILTTARLDPQPDQATRRASRLELPPISMPGPYFVTDEPDELGWRGELVVTYADGAVVAAQYQETRLGYDGTRTVKVEDESFLQRYADRTGVNHAEVVDALVAGLVDGSSNADAVTGATLTATRFRRLVEKVQQQRTTPELPSHLCSD